MDLEVVGTISPFLSISLNHGEECYAEANAMVSMDTTIDLIGKARGGLASSLFRKFANNESFFLENFVAERGNGRVVLSPLMIGGIIILDVGMNQYYLNDGAFLAATQEVELDVASQGFLKAMFGDSGGFFITKTSGYGKVAVNGLGDLYCVEIDDGNSVIVDLGHLIAWDVDLQYSLSINTSKRGLIRKVMNSALSGEGLVYEFSGKGKVVICSRSTLSFFKWMQLGIIGLGKKKK